MVKRYYQKHKEKLPKNAREKYQNLSDEEKGKKRQKRPKIEIKTLQKKKKKKGVRVSIQQKCKQKLPEYRRNNYFT